jgi:hypothetical protein
VSTGLLSLVATLVSSKPSSQVPMQASSLHMYAVLRSACMNGVIGRISIQVRNLFRWWLQAGSSYLGAGDN